MIVAAIFYGVIVSSVVVAVSSFVALKRKGPGAVQLWDWLLLFVPFLLWWALALSGLRIKTLSNLVEPFLLVLLVAACFAVRVFLGGGWSHKRRALISFVLCVAGAVGFYVLVPALPE